MADQRIPTEISADEAHRLACPRTPLFDIRDEHERAAGVPPGALPASVSQLLEIARGGDRGGFVLCAEGVRSLAAVQRLRSEGLAGFASVAGGFAAWRRAGLPVVLAEGFDAAQSERYARHLVMPQVGPQGQRRLRDAAVLLVGLGGLNSPVALYLAAAGVGRLGLCDPDRVERSNLQRQVIHAERAIGTNKAQSARERIADLNPDVECVVIDHGIDAGNAHGLVADWDLVVDGTDSFEARYAVNAACVAHGRPLVYGAVMRFQGQVSVFCADRPGRQPGRPGPRAVPCFRCLVRAAPAAVDAPSCAEAGVLGVMPGIVGTLQANETLKLLLGVGRSLAGRLLLIDALSMEFRETRIAPNPACPDCGLR